MIVFILVLMAAGAAVSTDEEYRPYPICKDEEFLVISLKNRNLACTATKAPGQISLTKGNPCASSLNGNGQYKTKQTSVYSINTPWAKYRVECKYVQVKQPDGSTKLVLEKSDNTF